VPRELPTFPPLTASDTFGLLHVAGADVPVVVDPRPADNSSGRQLTVAVILQGVQLLLTYA
jgi:hypothetical protein